MRAVADYRCAQACKFVKTVPQCHESAAGNTVPPCSKKVGLSDGPGGISVPPASKKKWDGKFFRHTYPGAAVGQIFFFGWLQLQAHPAWGIPAWGGSGAVHTAQRAAWHKKAHASDQAGHVRTVRSSESHTTRAGAASLTGLSAYSHLRVARWATPSNQNPCRCQICWSDPCQCHRRSAAFCSV